MDWMLDWDPEVGLWWRTGTPGHTRATATLTRMHSVPDAACKLLAAAQAAELDSLPVAEVVATIRRHQETRPENRAYGCIRWYAEDPEVDDINAGFFTTLPLLLLKLCYSRKMPAAALSDMDHIFRDAIHWFRKETGEIGPMNYPNKFLGGLVCHWLLTEVLDAKEDVPALADRMRVAGAYYREGWGFGEHMSDTYCGVLLDELSALLCAATRLPPDLKALYSELLNQLVAIEDAFDGGPRVPKIRSYSYVTSPTHLLRYRHKVQAYQYRKDEDLLAQWIRVKTGPLLNERGWHSLVGPALPPQREVVIPCFDGAKATAAVESDIRIGSLSRFPLMINTEGQHAQSFPVCFWRPEGDWGFLQWSAVENGQEVGLPMLHAYSALTPKVLTKSVRPALAGKTYAVQKGGDMVVFRKMPGLVRSWARVSDGLRLVNGHAQVTERASGERWWQLLLDYPGRQVSVHHVEIMPDLYPAARLKPRLETVSPTVQDWKVSADEKVLNGVGELFLLWAFSLAGEVREPPRIRAWRDGRTPEMRWDIEWQWPGIKWRLRVDPHGPEPLREV